MMNYMKLKLYLIKLPPFGHQEYPYSLPELFTINKWYEGDLTPTMYDPQTLKPAPPSYVVRCNDGNYRKVDVEYFITLEEFRENKLKELGI
jgi:hypothetical protein